MHGDGAEVGRRVEPRQRLAPVERVADDGWQERGVEFVFEDQAEPGEMEGDRPGRLGRGYAGCCAA